MADSLFDDRVREGLRAGMDITPFTRTSLNGSVGYRKTAGDANPTISYSTNLRRTGLFNYGATLAISLFGFDGTTESGLGYNFRAQFPRGKIGNPYFVIGGYTYAVDGQSDSHRSSSIEVGTSFDFSQGYFIGGSTEWNTGDDIKGIRTLIEFGYRY
jgi:hypothetical protein